MQRQNIFLTRRIARLKQIKKTWNSAGAAFMPYQKITQQHDRIICQKTKQEESDERKENKNLGRLANSVMFLLQIHRIEVSLISKIKQKWIT